MFANKQMEKLHRGISQLLSSQPGSDFSTESDLNEASFLKDWQKCEY